MKTAPFQLAVVLSTYHNRLLVPFPEMRALLNYMTGQQVGLWEVPRAREMAAKHLLKQFPWLAEIDPPEGFRVDSGHAGKFVRQVASQIGTLQLDVKSMTRGTFKPITATAAMTKLRKAR